MIKFLLTYVPTWDININLILIDINKYKYLKLPISNYFFYHEFLNYSKIMQNRFILEFFYQNYHKKMF